MRKVKIISFCLFCFLHIGCLGQISEPISTDEITIRERPISFTSAIRIINSEKMGISFELPLNFTELTKELEATNLRGKVIRIESIFIDSLTRNILNIKFFPDNNGITLYENREASLKQRKESSTTTYFETIVDGNKGIGSETTSLRNGKGELYDTPRKIKVISFLNSGKSGLIEIVLNLNSTQNFEWNHFLSRIHLFSNH